MWLNAVRCCSNVLYRMGVEGDGDREREERAREYFDEHGHWPDQSA